MEKNQKRKINQNKEKPKKKKKKNNSTATFYLIIRIKKLTISFFTLNVGVSIRHIYEKHSVQFALTTKFKKP